MSSHGVRLPPSHASEARVQAATTMANRSCCEEAGITVTLPKPLTFRGEGRRLPCAPRGPKGTRPPVFRRMERHGGGQSPSCGRAGFARTAVSGHGQQRGSDRDEQSMIAGALVGSLCVQAPQAKRRLPAAQGPSRWPPSQGAATTSVPGAVLRAMGAITPSGLVGRIFDQKPPPRVDATRR